MKVLVIIDTQQELANLSVIQAALQLSPDIQVVDVVILGAHAKQIVDKLGQYSCVARLFFSEDARFTPLLAEQCAPVLATLILEQNYTHVLTVAASAGKNILPRLAAMLDVQPITDITTIISAERFERPIYAGNAIATVFSTDKIKLISIRATAFEANLSQLIDKNNNVIIQEITLDNIDSAAQRVRFISAETPVSVRPELTAAQMVVSGGRGLKSKENFALIEALADKLGAAIGATRAAVDAGFISNDHQVGQTGKIVAPQIYIAIGISGAIQHLAGMKDSKMIIAINKDPEAPIFQVADFALVGDLFVIIPELIKLL